jgi:4-aminobutyrate aminotransferase-like enzyme/Ser/Thr protein kinase RdoA (MazF antagonist)
MIALGEVDQGPSVPEPIATTAGRMVAVVQGPDGREYPATLATWVPGIPFARHEPRDARGLRQIGEKLARVDLKLSGLREPEADRPFDWDIRLAPGVVRALAVHIEGDGVRGDGVEDSGKGDRGVKQNGRREMVLAHMDKLEAVTASIADLPAQLIHGDANDYNVMVAPAGASIYVGLIDFGDLVYSWRVADPAIAAAYLAMNQSDPVSAIASLVAGYHSICPLLDAEFEILPHLVAARLCVSLCHSELRAKTEPGDAYQSISRAPGWDLLERLQEVHPRLLEYRIRAACGLEPCPRSRRLVAFLEESAPAAVLGLPLRGPVFDLSVGTVEFDGGLDPTDAAAWSAPFEKRMSMEKSQMAFGRYLEPRICYQAEQFAAATDGPERQRTIHLGIDLFAGEGTAVSTPYSAKVWSVVNNKQPLDYGPTVILEHEADGEPFWTLYGHLRADVLTNLKPGQTLKPGECFAHLGSSRENGGWPPHLHFQVFADVFETHGNLPGVAFPAHAKTWQSVSPDPDLILRSGHPTTFRAQPVGDLLASRARRFARNLSLAYQAPLHIVRGKGVHLFDAEGRAYLDCVNNVCHIGHAHPAVVQAASRQLSVLNTNTRYLHRNIVAYGDALSATLPEGLEVCFLVNSGSEANDLAMRLAQAATARAGMIVIEGGYHGNLSSLIDISSYKFAGPGGRGEPEHVQTVRAPGTFRCPHMTGADFAGDVARAASNLAASGFPPAAFIAESILSCGGQIVPPSGYLEAAYAHARRAGALCIADEVQTGFGRVGSHMWSFELQGVIPDIVTMGKPMGNGFPIGAVVTTRAIADAFAGGMEYFNTYGGNPVSCAVGLAVLETIKEEGLQDQARRTGGFLKAQLEAIAGKYPIIGDVRGEGLFLGFEMVRDPVSKDPAAEEAAHLVERMKESGVLLSTDGPRHNVIKIKPPLAFSEADAHELARKLMGVLAETYFRPSAES